MHPKGSSQGDGSDTKAVRSSDRLRRRPKLYGRSYYYYSPNLHNRKRNTKTRTAASQIAKMLHKGNKPARASSATNVGNVANDVQPVASDLRRSTRKRRLSVNLEDYTDSSGGEDEDMMSPAYRTLRSRVSNGVHRNRKAKETESAPRREGLRPRRSKIIANKRLKTESGANQDSSEEKDGPEETENGNELDDHDADDGEDEVEAEDEGNGEDEGDGEDEEEDGDDDEDEEQEGRKRYDLRNRAEVRRMPTEEINKQQQPRSPRRVLHQGMGTRNGRDVRRGGSRLHKRHRFARTDDSDDSLLVDELDQGPAIPWARGGNRSGPPWLFGGLDTYGSSSLGLNAGASGWGHQSDGLTALTSGVQTAGPSSKGGADIQPLQINENINFDDIGGLSEYINDLKEMVFFPLLYPEFFASYNITPPRGVLLCGPPGTGKTLIARALACAASKAGQKVSFYMRKGADVLSKWVGEAERQLKLLFEEAQRNQPSIIFFDEIDGLAPVRSSKQEQIHNSIVSTLLALMDGLDSRGQVVLIGATNRVDAIDGALRRPGRFDREFNFSLPGCEAQAEILDIHTRKWKNPPSRELKEELAASCVGYCGADLKALCTEAAIRAFREKYPQVYTSDDKYAIDVGLVKVNKSHFVEAMSAITPAAHRGSVVQSRPLSPVVLPCLHRHLLGSMSLISDIFPSSAMSSELTKLSMLSFGSAIPLVYRPRLLLLGGEGVGLDHLGPAILHELEKFPIHSLGLPSLLSDPGAKTPEEALVHIFSEARRTTPSILYIPMFNNWWENAHEQLRAVFLTLLEELPSNLPILLLATSYGELSDFEEQSVFDNRSVYTVDKLSGEDRSLFFDRLIEAALSVISGLNGKPDGPPFPELPKLPKEPTGPKPAEIKAKVEAEQHALRRLRMCLRDVCNRILYDKRFSAFHFPVTDEDAPNYRTIIQNPMDTATLLQRVDAGQYLTCSPFLQDVDLIVKNAKAYNGDDYAGARIVSRAYELRDVVHGMLAQMDPALLTYCDKIAAEGGPAQIPDDLSGSILGLAPVVQMGTVTRSSARLRNVQPEVNIDRDHEGLKKPKKTADAASTDSASDKPEHQDSDVEMTPLEAAKSNSSAPCSAEDPPRKEDEACGEEVSGDCSQDSVKSDEDMSSEIESVKGVLMERTESYSIPQMERIYTRIMKGVLETLDKGLGDDQSPKHSILRFLSEFAQLQANF
ncbi:ATPase family AAA domain-containing protein At1g05910 isoform X1 [Brassica napus]|uniref:ATPase family AAA domain-containing protein At1g05910 isoform X1 n=1 Tax=Brassica napus TaxID=3708 RepID=UPI002078760C|nr:ATPase family AAA domain-containing protein At1g05910 isoform X1 [Brassica napus]